MSQTTAPKPLTDPQHEAPSADAFLEASRPKLQQLEDLRLSKLLIYNQRKKWVIPIGIAGGLILGALDMALLHIQSGVEDRYFGLTFIGLLGLWGWLQWPKFQYKWAFKEMVLPTIANLFGAFTYNIDGKIPTAAMRPSKILPDYSGYESEDHFSGQYKQVDIEFSEIELTQRLGRRERRVFRGLAILLSSGTKKFLGHTIIKKDRGFLDRWWQTQSKKLQRADLMDVEFEKQFDVFTTDQVEARYLIDPKIIESLKALYEEYDGKNLSAAFYDQHVLILIASSKNHFEPASIHTPAVDDTTILSLRREVGEILAIIDRLALYARRNLRSSAAS